MAADNTQLAGNNPATDWVKPVKMIGFLVSTIER